MSDKCPSIKTVLYKSKILSNGEHPIMLRVCYNGKRSYKSLGISCLPKDWNEESGSVRKSHSMAKMMNRVIETAITDIKSKYLEYENNDIQYSSKTLVKATTKKTPSTMTLYQLFDERVAYFKSIESYNTATGYQTVANIFKRYTDNKDVELFTIDADWLTAFEFYLRKSYKDTSIKKFFDCIKAAFNHAVKKKYLEKSPLEGYEHPKKLNLSTKKRALSIVEITNLTKYYMDSYGVFGEKVKPVEEKCKKHYWNKWFRRRGTTKLTPIDAEQLSLALFLCSYYLQGLALVDLAKLRWKDFVSVDIIDAEQYAKDCGKYGVEYAEAYKEVKECYEIDVARSKTGKPVKIVVERRNVDLYLNPFYPDGDFEEEEIDEMYVFPIYADIVDDTENKRFGRMKYAIYLVNVNLKRIGDELGIPNLTFYAARHTYASMLYHSDVSTSLIAQNMGRSPAEIETYLKSFEQTKILEANEKTFVTGQKGYKEGRKEKPVSEEIRKAREEFAKKREEERMRLIEKYGSYDAMKNEIEKAWADSEEELQRMFGDDVEAKIAYLKQKTSAALESDENEGEK